eukprot:34824_1
MASLNDNDWCPIAPHITLVISILCVTISIVLMYCFWGNRESPAFAARRPIMTMTVSLSIIIAMLLPVLAGYNVCYQQGLQSTLYFNLTAGGIYSYALWLITYRTWLLFINWKMAALHMTLIQNSSYRLNIDQNLWCICYRLFATSVAIQCWHCILSIWVIVFILCAEQSFYFRDGFNGPWTLQIVFTIYCIVSFLVLIIARKMRDHFALMAEMKIQIVFAFVLGLAFIIIGEYLSNLTQSCLSPPQIVQLKIILNILRSFVSIVVFMAYGLIKFRFSFKGIKVHKSLFDTADIDKCVTSHRKDEYNHMNVDPFKFPNLLQFLSTNTKCYEAFQTHLVSCLAVENLLFFVAAQTFRLKVKIAMQAQADDTQVAAGQVQGEEEELIDRVSLEEERYFILRLDFFYLQNACGMDFNTLSIKDRWLQIYNNFISHTSPYQINLDSQTQLTLKQFRAKLDHHASFSAYEYIQSLEDAMIAIWNLMEALYVHFQLEDAYAGYIKQHFPQYA